jgi:hypothetical protein
MKTFQATSPAFRVVSNKRSAACDLEGEMVILNLDSGVYFGLNPVGASIWSHIQNECSFEDLINRLLEEYKVGRQQCEAEVMALLQKLGEYGLIDIHADAEAA